LLGFLKDEGITDVHVNTGTRTFANAVSYLLKAVETEFYFHLEDDWVFLKQMDITPLVLLMRTHSHIAQIRFSKEPLVRPDSRTIEKLAERGELYLLPGQQSFMDGIPLIESGIWSLNPHLARASIAKQFCGIPHNINPENYLFRQYVRGFGANGLFTYGVYGDSAYVKDIGRPSIVVRKIRTMRNILRDPSLISRAKRIRYAEKYKGQVYEQTV
jgi:hypothetical protein